MKILRDSFHDLCSDIVYSIIDEHLEINSTDFDRSTLDLVGKRVWELIGSCADDLPKASGRAFWLAWGKCTITHRGVAEMLNKSPDERRSSGKKLGKEAIKKRLSDARGKIREGVMQSVSQIDWIAEIDNGRFS